MKVSAISSANFSSAVLKQVKNYKVADSSVSEQKQENLNFKGKGFTILEGIGGAILGTIFAGPVGFLLGGAAGMGIGSQMYIDRCKEY